MGERELPKGWSIAKLGDNTLHHKQGIYTNTNYTETGIKLIRVTDIKEDGTLDYPSMPFLDLDQKTIEQFKAEIGDFIFARSGSIGRCAIVKENIPCVFGSFSIRFKLNLKIVDNEFFYYFMKLPNTQSKLKRKSHGSANINVNAENIKDLDVIIPPLPVQRQIVAVLDQAEAVKRRRQKADALTGALLQSVFREMFGDPVRNERRWPVKNFGEITTNLDEKRIPIKKSEREITNRLYPYYGASGIIDYVDDFIFDGDFLLIGEDGANLLARSSPIAFRASGKIWVNNHAHILQSKEETIDIYLEFFINSIDLEKYVTGSAQPKLTQKSLNGIEVPLPPLALQQQFARVVERVERIHEQQLASGKEIEGLCAGLLSLTLGAKT